MTEPMGEKHDEERRLENEVMAQFEKALNSPETPAPEKITDLSDELYHELLEIPGPQAEELRDQDDIDELMKLFAEAKGEAAQQYDLESLGKQFFERYTKELDEKYLPLGDESHKASRQPEEEKFELTLDDLPPEVPSQPEAPFELTLGDLPKAPNQAETKEAKIPKGDLKDSLLEVLQGMNENEQKDFLTKFKGKKVYEFTPTGQQYLQLKDKHISKGQKDLTFLIFGPDGKEVIGEKTWSIAKIKYRGWEKGAPGDDEKTAMFRDDAGKLSERTVEKIKESDIEKYSFEDAQGKAEVLGPETLVHYEKDGSMMYARRTEARPESKREKKPLSTKAQESRKLTAPEREKEWQGKTKVKLSKYSPDFRDDIKIKYAQAAQQLEGFVLQKSMEFDQKHNEKGVKFFHDAREKLKKFMEGSDGKRGALERIEKGDMTMDQAEKDMETFQKKLQDYKGKAEKFNRPKVVKDAVPSQDDQEPDIDPVDRLFENIKENIKPIVKGILEKMDRHPFYSAGITTTTGIVLGWAVGSGLTGGIGGVTGILAYSAGRYIYRRVRKKAKEKQKAEATAAPKAAEAPATPGETPAVKVTIEAPQLEKSFEPNPADIVVPNAATEKAKAAEQPAPEVSKEASKNMQNLLKSVLVYARMSEGDKEVGGKKVGVMELEDLAALAPDALMGFLTDVQTAAAGKKEKNNIDTMTLNRLESIFEISGKKGEVIANLIKPVLAEKQKKAEKLKSKEAAQKQEKENENKKMVDFIFKFLEKLPKKDFTRKQIVDELAYLSDKYEPIRGLSREKFEKLGKEDQGRLYKVRDFFVTIDGQLTRKMKKEKRNNADAIYEFLTKHAK